MGEICKHRVVVVVTSKHKVEVAETCTHRVVGAERGKCKGCNWMRLHC